MLLAWVLGAGARVGAINGDEVDGGQGHSSDPLSDHFHAPGLLHVLFWRQGCIGHGIWATLGAIWQESLHHCSM